MMAQVLFFDIFSKKTCTLMLLSESNIQNSELNKVTSLLSKVPLCEKRSIEIHKKYHNNYITFTDNNKQVLPDHLFPKVICLLVGDSVLAGTKKKLKSGKFKVKERYSPGAFTGNMYY